MLDPRHNYMTSASQGLQTSPDDLARYQHQIGTIAQILDGNSLDTAALSLELLANYGTIGTNFAAAVSAALGRFQDFNVEILNQWQQHETATATALNAYLTNDSLSASSLELTNSLGVTNV